MIQYDATHKVFHLSNERFSYLIQVEEYGYLSHLYYGKAISNYHGLLAYPRTDRSFSPNPPQHPDRLFSIDTLLMEYPGYGYGDFREPAYNFKHTDGSRETDFRYESYEILDSKPSLKGLPATYAANGAQTLKIHLVDEVAALRLTLNYSLFPDSDVLVRSTSVENRGSQVVAIDHLASMSMDFPQQSLELIQLNGTWARERQITREALHTGIKSIDSKRGSSSHQQNPFAVLVEPNTTEFAGDAYGYCLIYSGNHRTTVQVDPYQQTRIMMGINPFNFTWQLAPTETFETPEVMMTYAANGLNQMSQSFHHFINQHLVRGKYQQQERPTLVNNWEATYFDFDSEKLLALLDEAADLGIEMFVLDDGWFGARESDFTSLGDWYENEGKITGGLKRISDEAHQRGVQFGLWFEPEMVSEDSDLFIAHPDWILQVPQRGRSLGRSQYVLDFSRQDVRDYIYGQMRQIFKTVNIDYVKWDMNRNMTEIYSTLLAPEQQGEVSHRYMLGLYDFLEKMITEFPDILFESCSGGGGRFDAGMLHYMPQTWTSDNTDAVARLKIQYGTSLAYPLSTMGAHVSAVPNHQTGRITSLETRGDTAFAGIFGYELDLTALSLAEKEAIKLQVAEYKKYRHLLQFGKFTRLVSPFESNDVAWMVTAPDQSEALVFYFRVLAEASYPLFNLKLADLDPKGAYQFNDDIYYGDELMNIGFYIDPELTGDYVSQRFYLKKLQD